MRSLPDVFKTRFALAFFFLFPIVFAAVPAFFGFPPPRAVSLYEGAKMAYLLIGSTVLALLFFRRDVATKILRAARLLRTILFSVVAFFGISIALNGTDPVSEILSGQTYSVAGIAALSITALVLFSIPEALWRGLLKALVLWFVAVNFPYALFQFFGFDPVAAHLVFPQWGEGRAFGTIGNPNSLALFAILCLPITHAFHQADREDTRTKTITHKKVFVRVSSRSAWWIISIALVAIVLTTKSVSGILGMAGYLAYAFLQIRSAGKNHSHSPCVPSVFFATFAAAILFAFAAFSFLPVEKILSLETRSAIVGESAKAAVSSVKTALVWNGAGAVEAFFQNSRSERISRHIAPDVPIARAHFAFFDLALPFGIPFALAVFVSLFYLARKNPEPSAWEVLGIFCIFGCLHTPWIAEWAIVLTALSVRPKRSVLPAETA